MIGAVHSSPSDLHVLLWGILAVVGGFTALVAWRKGWKFVSRATQRAADDHIRQAMKDNMKENIDGVERRLGDSISAMEQRLGKKIDESDVRVVGRIDAHTAEEARYVEGVTQRLDAYEKWTVEHDEAHAEMYSGITKRLDRHEEDIMRLGIQQETLKGNVK